MSPHSGVEGEISYHAPAFAVPAQSAQFFNALYEQAVVGVALVSLPLGEPFVGRSTTTQLWLESPRGYPLGQVY